jgi:hypothetical protein
MGLVIDFHGFSVKKLCIKYDKLMGLVGEEKEVYL